MANVRNGLTSSVYDNYYERVIAQKYTHTIAKSCKSCGHRMRNYNAIHIIINSNSCVTKLHSYYLVTGMNCAVDVLKSRYCFKVIF